ncbi:hypothetical protein [Paraburkholderia domus]|uniref:Uncharacterized protein n=1 Tax=Paraburkholderia domus TaxID=2793075 RepID=A0A9N8R7D6_9BURK|nr:hypothetical protein [Paraburkholderia domus]MBK5162769.1 hypothetical protein [Burkholderia sp. R-70211]CAE6958755.1 hypothetical protein R70211_06780 [Paraburkholderia domus]
MSLDAGSGTRTGATGFQESDTSNVLFDETSTTNISATIQVDDEPAIIRAHHLDVGESVLVEIVDGLGGGEHFSPYMRGGSQVRLTRKCNVTTLAMPGRYRFILQGVVGVAYVRQFRASMTHEFLLESQNMGCCDEIPACLPPCGDASGDLTGTYPNPGVDPVKVADKVSGSNSALVILADALCAKMQACLAEVFRKCDGSAHGVGDNIPTCQEMQDAIAKLSSSLVDCNGNPIASGSHIATCDQVDAEITAAVGSIPADKFLQDVQYDPNTHTITFKVADGGDTFTVNLSDLLPIVVGQGLTGNGTAGTPAAVKVANGGGLSVSSQGVAARLSSDSGNTLTIGSDSGLLVTPVASGQTSQSKPLKFDYSPVDWASAGSPSTWRLDNFLVSIPDSMLNKTLLLAMHQDCFPIMNSEFSYLLSKATGVGADVAVLPMFNLGGLSAGDLATRWDANLPNPAWGWYIVNASKVAMTSGSTIQITRTLYGVNYTDSTNGIIRLSQTFTLLALG